MAMIAINCGWAVGSAEHVESVFVTASRQEMPLIGLAGSAGLLDTATLELNAHTHIQESLARLAGVNFARGNGQEYLPSLRSQVLTGAGACGGLLMAADNVPLRSSGFCNVNELFEANTEQAQRIEVLRGSGSALYGSNAVHGIVNVISGEMDERPNAQLGLELGPNDYSRANFSSLAVSGDQAFRVDLNSAHDGGYRDNSGYDQQKLTLKHRYKGDLLTVSSVLNASNLNQETAGYIVGFESYKDDNLKNSNPNPEAYRDVQSVRYHSQFDIQLDDKRQLSLTPYTRYTKMDFLQHFLPGTPLEINGQRSVGLQSAYYHQFGERWRLIGGIDLEFTNAYLKQRQDQPTQGSLFLQTTIPVGMHYDYDVDARVIAPFTQIDYQASDKLSLTLGLRYESIHYDYDNRMLDGRTDDQGNVCGMGGCRYSRPADRDDRFNNMSPKFGLVYSFSEQDVFYIKLSHGFRAPQATELYRLQREQEAADLDSVEVNSFELGLRGEREKFNYELALYSMEKDNVIFRDSSFFNVSNAKTDHYGLEATARYQFNEQFYVALAASYARHKYASDQVLSGVNVNGNDIDSAPRHFGSAQLGWDIAADKRVELEWVHRSKEYTDPANLNTYEGHDLLHLRGSWQMSSRLSLSAKITNLTDTDYAERADYSSFTGDRYFTGEPRSYYFGLKIHW